MNYIVIFFLMLILPATMVAQVPLSPMSNQNLNGVLAQLEKKKFNQERSDIIESTLQRNYLLTHQLKQLLEKINYEEDKKRLAQIAYPKIYDQANFSQVYSILRYRFTKSELKEWVEKQPHNDLNSPPSLSVPSEQRFDQVYQKIKAATFESDKMAFAKCLVDKEYLYAAQVRDIIALLKYHLYQEEFARYAYPKTYDQQNYYLVVDGLSHSTSKEQLDDWLLEQPITNHGNDETPSLGWDDTPPSSSSPVIILSNEDFQTSKSAIEYYTSDSERLLAAKSVVDEHYIVSNQVAQLVELFVFDDVRLEFAQYAYAKTQDKENYKEVVDRMQNITSQEALYQYIHVYQSEH